MSSAPQKYPSRPSSAESAEPPLPPPKDYPDRGTAGRPRVGTQVQGRALSNASSTSINANSTRSGSITSESSTLATSTLAGSIFSPIGSSDSNSRFSINGNEDAAAINVISRALAPHVSVLSSQDCEELIRHKGIHGGFLDLLRPFGDSVPGRVVIRDSAGASKPWDDFGIRFTGVKDGLEAPRMGRSPSESRTSDMVAKLQDEYKPARLRSGGDVVQVEQFVESRIDQLEAESRSLSNSLETSPDRSAFFTLYSRKLLSGTVLSPHETFAHPVALVIAISSRSQSPIEDLRTLYSSSNTGEHRLPPWVNNEYLRYYVLVHDEDFDDIKKSTTLYEQMKRHFGLHCHLLRLRSTQALPSDDGVLSLPSKIWTSAAEDLSDMSTLDSLDDPPGPIYIFDSDVAAIRSFVREMVTQSILPSMERSIAIWNDQVASRRRGISGRFMSLSKRFTPFSSRTASPSPLSSGSNYDPSSPGGGSYRPDSPEAIMRKLADYAVMLRDYRLATGVYEILQGDFKNDKAWRHYAGASEMAAVSALMTQGNMSSRTRAETVDAWIENAYYSYYTRCNSPFYSLRTIVLTSELLRMRDGSALDDAARWMARLIDDRNIGPVGHALVLERIGATCAAKRGVGQLSSGNRRRKAALWMTLATSAWLDMGKTSCAKACLARAVELYGLQEDGDATLHFVNMMDHLAKLDAAANGQGAEPFPDLDDRVGEIQQITTETVDQPTHRRSVSLNPGAQASFDPLGAMPLVPTSPMPDRPSASEDDGFE